MLAMGVRRDVQDRLLGNFSVTHGECRHHLLKQTHITLRSNPLYHVGNGAPNYATKLNKTVSLMDLHITLAGPFKRVALVFLGVMLSLPLELQ